MRAGVGSWLKWSVEVDPIVNDGDMFDVKRLGDGSCREVADCYNMRGAMNVGRLDSLDPK